MIMKAKSMSFFYCFSERGKKITDFVPCPALPGCFGFAQHDGEGVVHYKTPGL